MKRKFFAVFLSLCMVMSLVPMAALAAPEDGNQAATKLPEAVDGVITLNEDVTLGKERVSIETSISTIDLNGHTLTAQISVAGNLTIKDGSENRSGKITSTGNPTVLITDTGSLVLDAGTIETTGTEKGPGAIRNQGSLTINGGLVTGTYGIRSGAQTAEGKLLDNNVSLTINGGTVHGDEYGIYTYGRGITEGGVTTVDNSQVSLTITGGRVECGEGKAAIGTNASSGKYAGYTFEMTGGEVDGSDTGTGLYLPAIGVNNISGGTITGAQAIRIAAGELNITGGQIISTGQNTGDIIAGGTGGASGALVIGKAGTGYVGNLIVNVSGNATLKNETQGNYPTAVFVTDKTMNHVSYDDVVIEVNIEDIEITGDILRVSDGEEKELAKGSTTSLNISNVTVTGDVANQSSNGNLLIDSSTVTGMVSNANEDATISINNSDVGSISGAEKDNIIFAGDSTVGREPQEATGVAMVNGKIYSDLNAAITAAEDGDTITLLQNIDKPSELKTGTTSGSNISLLSITKSVTIKGNGYGITITMPDAATNRSQAISVGSETNKNITVTLDDVDLTINGNSSDTDKGDAIDVWGTLNITNGSNITVEKAQSAFTMQGGESAKVNIDKASTVTANNIHGNFSNGGDWTLDDSSITINDCDSYGLSVTNLTTTGNSKLDISNTTFSAIYGHQSLNFGGNTVVNVSNCGPKEPGSGTEKYGFRDAPIQLRRGPAGAKSIAIGDNAVVNITNCVTEDGKSNNNLYVVAGTTFQNDGVLNGNLLVQDNAGSTSNVVRVINEGTVLCIRFVENQGTFELPDLPDQGYNHFVGWTDQAGKHYDGGDTVTITANTTFTAQWAYIPPANPNYKITIGDMENGSVTANPTAAKAGATVTLTATPDEGYALSTLTVTDRFGDAVKVTENADGTYTFTMPNGQVTVKATFVETEEPVAEPFVDVAEGDWFYDAVVYAYQNELMDGVGGNRFAPNSETTRAQLVTILYRLEGQPAVSGDLPFTDVETGIWYTDAILWAAQNNIVNGVNDTEFAPGDEITRQQLVTILYRYAEAKGYDVSASADLSGYPDADQVQDYAQPAMAWAVAENIIQGMEDGTLKPAGNASRAQIATILMRFCEDVAQ